MALYLYGSGSSRTGHEPWIYDSKLGTTKQLIDLWPGPSWGLDPNPADFWKFGSSMLFRGNTNEHGNELWITDGTAARTRLVSDIAPGLRDSFPDEVLVIDDVAYFAATTLEHGRELWRTDGTASGTWLVKDLQPGKEGSNPNNLTQFKDGFVFQPEGGGLWFFDGSEAIELTEPGKDFGYGSLAVGQKHIVFSRPLRASDELWLSDGTNQGTRVIFDQEDDLKIHKIIDIFAVDGKYLFTAEPDTGGTQLWTTAGTMQTTRLIYDLGRAEVGPLSPFGNSAIFQSDNDIWVSDGTASGSFPLLNDIDLYFGGRENMSEFYFTTGIGGTSTSTVWSTDGTVAGTKLVLTGEGVRLQAFEGEFLIVSRSNPELQRSEILKIKRDGNIIKQAEADVSGYEMISLAVNARGTAQSDTLRGGIDDDHLAGLSGNDRLLGSRGNDTLLGGIGEDSVSGGNGNDRLRGWLNTDTLSGGSGSDTFDFDATRESAVGAGRDIITDFDAGTPATVIDKIDLFHIDANELAGGNQQFVFIGTSAFALDTPGRVRAVQTNFGTVVALNTDNDTAAEMHIALRGVINLFASDFVL